MTGHTPKKYLGQNFLNDRNTAGKIARCAGLAAGDHVLEIGPGRGAITDLIVPCVSSFVAVEFDHALARELTEKYAGTPHVKILDADILKIPLGEILSGPKWKVVANLPYNISSAVLFRLLEHRSLFSGMTLMLQKEVAERLVAPPGTKEYGITTLLLGLHFDIRIEFIVPRTCFFPQPKVLSAVTSFLPLERPRADVGDEGVFCRVVKSAFGMRRKMLINSLKGANPDGLDVKELLDSAGIDGTRRGETLSFEEFACLSRNWTDALSGKTAGTAA